MYSVLLTLYSNCEAAYQGRPFVMHSLSGNAAMQHRKLAHLDRQLILVERKVRVQDRELVVLGTYMKE